MNYSNLRPYCLFSLLFFIISCAIRCDEVHFELEVFDTAEYLLPEKHEIDYSTRLYNSICLEDGYYHDQPKNEGVQNVQKRVQQFLNIEWTALHNIPKHPEGYFVAGNNYNGIPYSFAAESDGIVGLDISIDTFMSAVNNPYSFLYTVDLRTSPYTEILAGPYYGVVCSSAVSYFLGMDFHYVTYLLDSSPYLVRLPEQNPNNIRIGDIIWKNNHVMLVYDIIRNTDGSIAQVTLAEGNIPLTRSIKMSYNEFSYKWKDDGYVIYCYTDIGKTTYPQSKYIKLNGEVITNTANNTICTARGNSVSFRIGEPVEINTISSSDCTVSLYKDGTYIGDYNSSNHKLVIKGLGYGGYCASLGSGGDATYFNIVDYSVDVKQIENGLVRIYFRSNNAKPRYVSLCNSKYRYKAVYPLSEQDIEKGYINISPVENDSYVRVFFYGEYGRVSSELIQIPS